MPEGLEAEIWRAELEPLVGRLVTAVWVDERVAPDGFVAAVTGTAVTGVRRRGKVVLIDTDGPTIGLHLGMTGRLVVDGRAAIDKLEYASGRDDPTWDRLRLSTAAAPRGTPGVRLNDPRRLGRVSLDPDLSHLGVDFGAVTPRRLAAALAPRRRAIKPVLLDQTVVAGLGNMCADEVLWWAGIAPHRATDMLTGVEIERLAGAIRRRMAVMLRRGGSSTGTLSPAVRAQCPPCSRDGSPLRRETIAGRTAVWCPTHQR
jgi:formamidopyrimidine-DNA glycosylase